MRIGFISVAMIFLILSVMSCSASRQNGFSYRPAHAGPDVSGTVSEDPLATEIPMAGSPVSVQEKSNALAGEGDENAAADLAKIVEQQVAANSSAEKVDAKKAVQDIAIAYTEKKNISLTQKQWHKLDRYAAKMERKQQQKAEVEWGPKNNLEIFLLAAAGVGLVVGFFSSFGWFIFLVAALVYLYLKLLKN